MGTLFVYVKFPFQSHLKNICLNYQLQRLLLDINANFFREAYCLFHWCISIIKEKTEHTFILAFSSPFVHVLYCISDFFWIHTSRWSCDRPPLEPNLYNSLSKIESLKIKLSYFEIYSISIVYLVSNFRTHKALIINRRSHTILMQIANKISIFFLSH